MQTFFLSRIFVVILVALALTVANAGRERSQQAADGPAISESSPPAPKFTCLPKGVRLDEVVAIERGDRPGITVERELINMKARCRNGRLVDAKRREIRFFRVSCWGNPPENYLEIQQRESKELARLKRRYRVIVFGCNRMIP
jgi:hypothetical protein